MVVGVQSFFPSSSQYHKQPDVKMVEFAIDLAGSSKIEEIYIKYLNKNNVIV